MGFRLPVKFFADEERSRFNRGGQPYPMKLSFFSIRAAAFLVKPITQTKKYYPMLFLCQLGIFSVFQRKNKYIQNVGYLITRVGLLEFI